MSLAASRFELSFEKLFQFWILCVLSCAGGGADVGKWDTEEIKISV